MSLNPCCNGIWSQTTLKPCSQRICLNPCCNGIWSQTESDEYSVYEGGLNPCCNGIWSQTSYNYGKD